MPPTWESRFRGIVAGVIEQVAQGSATNKNLWAAVKAEIAKNPIAIGRQGQAIVNELRSAALARKRGADQFAKARADQLLTPRMAAPDSYMRSAIVRQMSPEYRVRFDLTFIDPNGAEVTKTVSMKDVWVPGLTVGDVHDAVAEAAEGMGNSYGQGMVSIANLRPVQI